MHANCLVVKGHTRSTINDLYRYRYKLIPNLLTEILEECRQKPYHEVLEDYIDEKEGIEKYIGLLVADDWGMFTGTPGKFPAIREHWDSPSVITNAIIDYTSASTYDICDVIAQLNDMGCEALQLRVYDQVPEALIAGVYNFLAGTSIQHIEFLLKYEAHYPPLMETLHRQLSRVQRVRFHSAPFDREEEIRTEVSFYATHSYTTTAVTDSSCCGFVHTDYFTVNLPFWMEGLQYNNCLNRKIGIDVHGNIKNCPSAAQQFGNIAGTKLSEALTDDFKKIWSVNKDHISECNICEFRRICPDCRVFTVQPGDRYSKPSKCTYNPATGVWAE